MPALIGIPTIPLPLSVSDETTLYVVAKTNSTGHGYLLALDSTTLATKHRVFLTDPRNSNSAAISDDQHGLAHGRA